VRISLLYEIARQPDGWRGCCAASLMPINRRQAGTTGTRACKASWYLATIPHNFRIARSKLRAAVGLVKKES